MSSTAKVPPPSSSDTDARAPKKRRMLSQTSSTLSSTSSSNNIVERTAAMKERATAGTPLTDNELDDVVTSLQNIAPESYNLNVDELRAVLKDVGHLSHKDWARTGRNAERLREILLRDGVNEPARMLLFRILSEGNWDGAAQHAVQERPSSELPWAVLVTGVNGIRKTTSLYQPWFPKLLEEALVPPSGQSADTSNPTMLPSGVNSFFRQLDHMIATLCNEDFAQLYALTMDLMTAESYQNPPADVVEQYSNLKEAIFARYRTLSELLGAILLEEAKLIQSNVLLETSGKDMAMFSYIDHFFPEQYHKLALHFQVNDLTHAQKSVDSRMIREIQTGLDAIAGGDDKTDVRAIIQANAGGPYGSQVLPSVQSGSDKVWEQFLEQSSGNDKDAIGRDWYKATIQINAHETEPWTAQAVRPDGSLGTVFTFERR